MEIFKILGPIVASGTFRRLAITLIGLGTAALNRKCGLDLSANELFDMGAIAIGYVAQSAYREANQK